LKRRKIELVLRRNILIFHLGALGDFIVTWPLALALARLYPQSRVFYVTHGQKGALAERVLRVESIDIETGWHALFNDPAALPEPAARALASAHTIVSFLSNGRDEWTNNVHRLNADASVIGLTTVAPNDFPGHISEFLVDQLQSTPAIQSATAQILKSIAERGISFPLRPNGYVLIHPGSGAPRKNWPAQRFLELIRQLRGARREIRVILGEVELEQWPQELIAQFKSEGEISQPQNLLELLAEISRASIFVGNDSGPAHLAGILGIPTVTLFAGTQTTRWRPLGPHVHVLPGPLDQIDVQTVFRTVQESQT